MHVQVYVCACGIRSSDGAIRGRGRARGRATEIKSEVEERKVEEGKVEEGKVEEAALRQGSVKLQAARKSV